MRSFIKAIVCVVLLASMSHAGAFANFINQIFSDGDASEIISGYPSAERAFRDYAGSKSFMFSKEALKGIFGFEPYKFNHSYRIPFMYNIDDGRIVGIESVVIQMVVTYRADKSEGDPDIPDSLCLFIHSDRSHYYIRDRIFIYYTKTVDGWLYVGAETSFTGFVYREFFIDNPLVFWGGPFGKGYGEDGCK
jgi:hypothetical protein